MQLATSRLSDLETPRPSTVRGEFRPTQ